MTVRNTMNVSLTPELEAFVQQRVLSGRYQTASEVIREGLRLLEYQERDRDASFATLREKLKRATEQADEGKFISPSATLAKIRTRKIKRAKRSA